MSRSLALLLAATTLTGCFHTTLSPPPPPGAPLGDRVNAYNQLRKSGELHTITVTTNQHGTSVSHELDLVLANGETVRHADDLLPVIAEESAAARSARRSGDARGKKIGWMLGGSAVMAGGFVLALSTPHRPLEEGEDGRLKMGMGIAIVGALAATIGGVYYRHVEHSQRRAAFANYDEGLRARMSLCVNGMQIVDCNQPSGPPGVSLRMSASPR